MTKDEKEARSKKGKVGAVVTAEVGDVEMKIEQVEENITVIDSYDGGDVNCTPAMS